MKKTDGMGNRSAQREWDALLLCVRRPCILCGRTPAGGAGIWVPTSDYDRLAVRAPRGKVRLVVYPLCQPCQATPGVYDRVEKAIRAEFVVLS